MVAVVVAALMLGHAAVPNAVGSLGSLLEALLPWLGLTVPVLVLLALLRRSVLGLLAVLVPAVAWLGLFGGYLVGGSEARYDVTAVQHNVSDENADPAGTARALAGARPDLIGLEELLPPALATYERVLGSEYPHHAVYGTVGLWSRYPLVDSRLLDIRPTGVGAGWNRGLRATVRMPKGDIAVVVAHLPSVRLRLGVGFDAAWRDESAARLGAAIAAEDLGTVILLGDFNSTVQDRGLAPVTSLMTSTGRGFEFSWPAAFPVARVDQIMARSAAVTSLRTLPATGSDHLPVVARLRLSADDAG